ncbi:MAG: nucleotidyl transferase AbiEii/AbiGii toxin family protein [Micrococcales bacterium]|nr:nucleotidyl transferase AbiEii/AbiGii toxin family protein [Micrococcales bacterium]
MITRRELDQLRGEWSLAVDVLEKDYALGWTLAGIAQHPDLASMWVFKGGTCLRKCFYETYRFSEDLDFTVVANGPEEPAELQSIFAEVADWVYDESGIELVVDDSTFRHGENRRGKRTTQGRLAYRGPNASRRTPPKVKLDLTSDEAVVLEPVTRRIVHHYSDGPLPVRGVLAYPITELFAEKLRALSERCRPRDLYDVIYLHRHPDLYGKATEVEEVLREKCAFVGIAVPTLESLLTTPYRVEIEGEWESMLGHQLPKPLPPFLSHWNALGDVFDWLAGLRQTVELPRAEQEGLDPEGLSPVAIRTWERGFPLQLLQYSAANRLCVEVNYHAKDGKVGPKIVEPYSLRRTREGNYLLFVVNDQGLLRSFRVDRIAGMRPTTQTFDPKYRVEL